MIPSWMSFLIALLIIIIVSRKELALGLLIGSFIFALLTEISLVTSIGSVIMDISTIILLAIVALIPILGGLMEDSHLMKEMIEDLQVSKKMALILTPAMFGLLPVAGGALMSAPIIDQIDPDKKIPSGKKAAINVWFRHVVVLIYPLTSELLIASELSGIPLYTQVALLLIPFTVMVVVGYFTLIHRVDLPKSDQPRNLKRALHHSLPILIAPILDLSSRILFPSFPYPRIFMLIGLILSLLLILYYTKYSFAQITKITKVMKIWRFPLMIFAIFWFLKIFELSGLPEFIGNYNFPFLLFLLLGFLLGVSTGRISLPVTILFPIYLSQFDLTVFPFFEFTLLYSAIFLGYWITPIHPCISYTSEYYKIKLMQFLRYFALPIIICVSIIILLFFFSIII